MQCAVYDTYVRKKDGNVMHFDVVVEAKTPHEKAIEYGKKYLESVGEGQAPPTIETDIQSNGYFIQKMEGCPA